jgi:hypothetical protein
VSANHKGESGIKKGRKSGTGTDVENGNILAYIALNFVSDIE